MTGAHCAYGAHAPGVLHSDLTACQSYGNGVVDAAAVRCPVLASWVGATMAPVRRPGAADTAGRVVTCRAAAMMAETRRRARRIALVSPASPGRQTVALVRRPGSLRVAESAHE
jgi:hypothetical protein